MTRIDVDPNALSGAGRSVTAIGDEIATAVGTLSSNLGSGAPSGLDAAGVAFGLTYQKSAQALLEAAGSSVDASRNVGFGVGMSATNYSQADTASTIGGGATPVQAAEKPSGFHTPTLPSSLGGGVPPPVLWSVLQTFIPDTWPDGDPTRLRASAQAWQNFATAINGIAGGLSGPSAVIAGQHIPEGGAMSSAMSELTQSLAGVATEAGNLATQTREFADDVQATQNAIRDLCDRASPSGFFDGLKAVFSGDALDEIKEIADDVKEVLNNFGRQADGRISLMQSLITALDDAVVSMQQSARREFTHYLGEDVGGALATQLEFRSNLSEGIIKAGLETVVGIQELDPTRFASDPDGAGAAWTGVLDTLKYANPTGVAMDPAGALEHGKDLVGGIAHAEDWRADRPGLGLGGVLFEAGSAATGVGAAKTGLRGMSAAADAGEAGPAVRAAAGAAESTAPIAGRVSEITGKLDDLTTLADDLPAGAASDARGPALPPALAEPDVPVLSETATAIDASAPGRLDHDSPVARPTTDSLSSPTSADSPSSRASGVVPQQAVDATGTSASQASPSPSATATPTQLPSPVAPAHPFDPLPPHSSPDLRQTGPAVEAGRCQDVASSWSSQWHPETSPVAPTEPTPQNLGHPVQSPQADAASPSADTRGGDLNAEGDGRGGGDQLGEPDVVGDSGVPHHLSGLSEVLRDEILSTEKGQRPDPSEYLTPEYIREHLDKFSDGASRFMPETNLNRYGIAQVDGTSFMMTRTDADALLQSTGGDPRAMEHALGLPQGFLDDNRIVRIDVPDPDNYNLRIPSGNEAGANEDWIPGGLLPDGLPEAVIDGRDVPPDGYSVSDIDDWED